MILNEKTNWAYTKQLTKQWKFHKIYTFKCSVRALTRALIEALNTAVEASFRPSTAARRNSNSCSLTVSRRNTIASANCFLLMFFSDSHSNKCFSNASHLAFNCLQIEKNNYIKKYSLIKSNRLIVFNWNKNFNFIF